MLPGYDKSRPESYANSLPANVWCLVQVDSFAERVRPDRPPELGDSFASRSAHDQQPIRAQLTMPGFAALEIGLRRGFANGTYGVELRFSITGSDADELSLHDGGVHLDLARLRQLEDDPQEYGRLLARDFLAEAVVRDDCVKALQTARARDIPLRLRLVVSTSAPELHSVFWEGIRNESDGSLLFAGEQILFSRYLSSPDWRPVTVGARGELRALVVIADPTDLDEYQLAHIPVEQERNRIKRSLGDIPVDFLAEPGEATENGIYDALREGYAIFHLVCHGTLVNGEPWLWLLGNSGKAQQVSGTAFAARLRDLQHRPRLIVLASCNGAGAGPGSRRAEVGAFAALGPRLAEAGVPAVLAMQGRVSVETLSAFMPPFFRELLRDGQIDRAMAVARGAVRDRPDAWMPVLYLRSRSGKLWYVPGFGADQEDPIRWPAMLRRLNDQKCTPILGHGVLDAYVGSFRTMAKRWAETYDFPMSPYDQDDLPQVAQYLKVRQDPDFPPSELKDYIRVQLIQRFGAELSTAVRDSPLRQLVRIVATGVRERDQSEPHSVLARLPVPIYVTTNADDLLLDALAEAGKQPEREICRWRNTEDAIPSVYDTEPGFRPTVQRPLVYHLYGHLEYPSTIVLTEDDYFDFLIGLTRSKDLIPGAVRRALVDSALLFIGFSLDAWEFRVLFRTIVGSEGQMMQRKYRHVAVQLDPDESRTQEPERARAYLQESFGPANISIFWGTPAEFLREVGDRWRRENSTGKHP